MKVNFYATLRAAAGGKTVEVRVPMQSTVRTVLEAATRERPALAEHIWQTSGRIYEHIRVFVNGRDATLLPQRLETLIQAEDNVDVFPPVGGGRE